VVMRGDKDCCSAVCSGADDAEACRGGGTVSHTRIDPTTHHSHNRGCEVPVASSLARGEWVGVCTWGQLLHRGPIGETGDRDPVPAAAVSE
jgi:hypothetical protein